jgi:hypothetical protein
MTDTTKTSEALAALLDEVRQCFTRDDDLPGNLLHRIDEALAAQPQAEPAGAAEAPTNNRAIGRIRVGKDSHPYATLDTAYDVLGNSWADGTLLYTAPVAAAQPVAQGLTDEQCEAIYNALDEFAREMDSYVYGLPMLALEDRKVRAFPAMRAALSTAHPAQADDAPVGTKLYKDHTP